MSFNIFSLGVVCFSLLISTGVEAQKKSPRAQSKASSASVSPEKPEAGSSEEDQVELTKSMESEWGKIDLKIDEKPQPEPALKPYWLNVKVSCKSGKRYTKRYDVCDSDLNMTVEDGVLKTSYFLGDPQATDDDSQEDELVCDEENPVNIEINLKTVCAGNSKSSSKKSK